MDQRAQPHPRSHAAPVRTHILHQQITPRPPCASVRTQLLLPRTPDRIRAVIGHGRSHMPIASARRVGRHREFTFDRRCRPGHNQARDCLRRSGLGTHRESFENSSVARYKIGFGCTTTGFRSMQTTGIRLAERCTRARSAILAERSCCSRPAAESRPIITATSAHSSHKPDFRRSPMTIAASVSLALGHCAAWKRVLKIGRFLMHPPRFASCSHAFCGLRSQA